MSRSGVERQPLSPAVAKVLLLILVAIFLVAALTHVLRRPVSILWRAWRNWRDFIDLPPLQAEEADETATAQKLSFEAKTEGAQPRSLSKTRQLCAAASEEQNAEVETDFNDKHLLPPSFLVYDDEARALTTAEELRRRRRRESPDMISSVDAVVAGAP